MATNNDRVRAEKLADEIVGFLFDDYPDNDMKRGEGTKHVAAIISRRIAENESTSTVLCPESNNDSSQATHSVTGDVDA